LLECRQEVRSVTGKVPFIKVDSLIVSEFEPIVAVVNAKVGCNVEM